MFIFINKKNAFGFICQQRIGFARIYPEVSVCLAEFDTLHYRDALFSQLSIPFPEQLNSAVTKRRAEYLAGRYAARQLLVGAEDYGDVVTGVDRAPIWPTGWRGSISHTEKWAIAIITPCCSEISLGVDIEKFRPDIMGEIATTFTTSYERDILVASHLPYEVALFILFSAKESLFKALYPWVQHIFGFEAAKLCGLDTHRNCFTLELTQQLAPGLFSGYRVTGHYVITQDNVITMVTTNCGDFGTLGNVFNSQRDG